MLEEKETEVFREEDLEEETEAVEGEVLEVNDEEADSGKITLEKEIATLKDENSLLQDKLLRLNAEFDNFKKRTVKEKSAAHKYKAEDFALELLPIIDNFERALQTENPDENKGFYDGIEMVYKQLLQALDAQEIKAIASIGEIFDPNRHHAVMQTEDEDKDSNTVVEELQKGYMLKDKVIRPSMVKVNK